MNLARCLLPIFLLLKQQGAHGLAFGASWGPGRASQLGHNFLRVSGCVMSWIKMRRLGVALLSLLLAAASAQECVSQLDVIVSLDSSPSVQYYNSSNWDFQINFTMAVMNKLDLGPEKSRLGIVRFDDEAAIELSLDQGDSEKAVKEKLSDLFKKKNSYRGKHTDMGIALSTIKTEFKQHERTQYKKVLLFISDGDANFETTNLVPDAQMLRIESDVLVICISISKITKRGIMFLNSLTKDGASTYNITDPSTIDTVLNRLSRVCVQRDFVPPENCFQNSGAGDIVFILDSSGSITQNGKTLENWNLAKLFLSDLAEQLKQGAKDSHMALIEFSDTQRTKIVFDLNERNVTDMQVQILDRENLGSTTDTRTALKLATEILRGFGNRMGVPDVIILLTDGYSSVNMGSPIPTAEQLHRERVTVFTVGITDKVKIAELAAISSPPHRFEETFWVTPGFDALNGLVDSIYQRVCNIVPPSPKLGDVVDMCFILDVSGSITYYDEQNFFDMLDFVKNIIFSFDIGLSKTRVALIAFSNNASLKFDLDDHDNVAAISAEIDKLKNEKGKTNIAAGLRMADRQVFVPEGGHREDARGVIFLLTDGKDTENSDYWLAARALQQRGIEIFAVGVTDEVDMNQLNVIGSNPKPAHVFTALNYNFLGNIVGEVLGSVEPKTTTPEPLTTTVSPSQSPSQTQSGSDVGLFGQAQPGVTSSMGCKNPADLLILIDVSSATKSSDVEKVKQLVAALVLASSVGPDDVNIEIMTIGAQVNRIVRFSESLSKEDIISRIATVSHQGGTKNLVELIKVISEDVFDLGSADRILYPNLALFFMAGSSNNPKETIKQAAILRQHAIHMVVLGMNNDVSMAEAYAIASYPQTFNFRPNVIDVISTPEGLQQSAAALVEILCNNVNECEKSPCMYNGTCIDTIDAFACQCTKGRGGPRCTQECSGSQDIVVAIDEAAITTAEDALSVFQWTQKFIDQLPAGGQDTRVSLAYLNEDRVHVIYHLTKYVTKIQRLHAVPLPSYNASWVDLHSALKYIDNKVFTADNGDRPDAKNVVILVSNGETKANGPMTRNPNGAQVIVVAQRKYARWQKLDGLASEPVEANIIATDDYPYMSEIMRDVVTSVCDDGGLCKDIPCGNGGTCVSMGDEFICKCPPSHTGMTCEEPLFSKCQLDLVAIIDVSGRQSTQRLNDVKKFLKDIIGNVEISPVETHVGLIVFSDTASTKVSLNTRMDKDQLLKEIDSVVWEGNDSNLMAGLRRVHMDMTRASRPHADKIILLFTDGAPTMKGPQTLDEALQVKLEGWRVMVFSVGLDLDPVKIRALASHPIEKNAVILDDWMKLPSKTEWVTDQLCHSHNSCDEKPCENAGVCEVVWDAHICHCPVDFAGPNCQKRCSSPVRYDVALLADESAGNNPLIHWRMLTVIWSLIDSLTFVNDATHLAYATFSNLTAPRWSLGQRNSKRHLLELVSINKNSAFSDPMSALRTAKLHMFTESQGNRADVNNVIVMLVDSSHRVQEHNEQNLLSDLVGGDYETTTVFVIAFGKDIQGNPYLAKLASATSKPYFTLVENDDDVSKAVDVIMDALCIAN